MKAAGQQRARVGAPRDALASHVCWCRGAQANVVPAGVRMGHERCKWWGTPGTTSGFVRPGRQAGQSDSNERDVKTGRFQKGHKRLGGNVKGSKHKITKTVAELIVSGIGKSKNAEGGGIEGFAQHLADRHPNAASSLLSKVADRVKPPAPAAISNSDAFRIVSVPSGHFYRRERQSDRAGSGPATRGFRTRLPWSALPIPERYAAAASAARDRARSSACDGRR